MFSVRYVSDFYNKDKLTAHIFLWFLYTTIVLEIRKLSEVYEKKWKEIIPERGL